MSGVATATATRVTPTVTTVRMIDEVMSLSGLLFEMHGADEFRYFIDSDAKVDDVFYDDAGTLRFGGALAFSAQSLSGVVPVCGPLAGTIDDREVVMSPVPLTTAPGVRLVRTLFSPVAGKFLRIVDRYTNTTAVAMQVPVSMSTGIGSSQGFIGDVAPSTTTGGYFARHDLNGQALAYAVVYAGVNPPAAITAVENVDGTAIAPTATLTIAPGQSVSLMHYVVARAPGDQNAVVTAADALTMLDDPDALSSLTPAEQAEIVNFRLVP